MFSALRLGLIEFEYVLQNVNAPLFHVRLVKLSLLNLVMFFSLNDYFCLTENKSFPAGIGNYLSNVCFLINE